MHMGVSGRGRTACALMSSREEKNAHEMTDDMSHALRVIVRLYVCHEPTGTTHRILSMHVGMCVCVCVCMFTVHSV